MQGVVGVGVGEGGWTREGGVGGVALGALVPVGGEVGAEGLTLGVGVGGEEGEGGLLGPGVGVRLLGLRVPLGLLGLHLQ